MSGVILNVTDLNSNSNHTRNRQNDIGSVCGEIIVENIEEKQINDAVNTVIIGDINSNTKNAEPECATTTAAEATDETPEHRTPTAQSLTNSNNISVTLDHNDDSSVFDSSSDLDSDLDSDFEDIVQSPSSYLNNINLASSNGFMMIDKNLGGSMPTHSNITCTNNDIKPAIGSIAVQNSSDITFGNKTFYQGPVTIKQFVYDKNKWRETKLPSTSAASENDNLNSMKMENDDVESKWRCTRRQILYGSAIGGIFACLLVVLIVIIKFTSSVQNKGSGYDDDAIITNSSSDLRLVTRKEWLAQPPAGELERQFELPVGRVIIAHTVTGECKTQSACSQQVRNIQAQHNALDYDDIGYNFLAGGDGAIYEGRAWNWIGAHTRGYNAGSICFAFIGDFTSVVPTQQQLGAVLKMINEGIKLKKLTADYKLFAHCQLIATESPGKVLYKIIQTWDHWTNESAGPPNP